MWWSNPLGDKESDDRRSVMLIRHIRHKGSGVGEWRILMGSIIYFNSGQSIRVDNDLKEVESKLIKDKWLHITGRNNILEDKHQILVNTRAVTRVEEFNDDPA